MSNTKNATKENTVIIMAADRGMFYEGYKSEGFKVYSSYKPANSIMRVIREVYFRIPFLSKKMWFNKEIIRLSPEFILVRDAIITRDYLLWLKKVFPQAQINFMYENMVGKAKHLLPKEIPTGIRVWTYDIRDSEKYGLNLRKTMLYFPAYVYKKQDPVFDVLFVGRDKGRGDWLNQLEKFLIQRGYRTCFLITADSKYSRKKPYYKKVVPYEQIAKWVSQSKCVINVAMENQTAVTVRDLECLFNKVKLITTNEAIKDAYFYNQNNVFIIKEDNWALLPAFIDTEYDDTIKIEIERHSANALIREVTT